MGSVSPLLLLLSSAVTNIRLWRGGKRKREDQAEEEEGRKGAKQARKKVETNSDMSMDAMDGEVEMSDMEAVVQQSTLYDELYRAYMLLREPLD